jgi:hypothetical protein
MERAAGFVYDDTPQAKLGKLNALLAHFSPNRLGRLAMEGAPSAICGRLLPNAEQATIPRSCIQPLAWSAHSPSSASAPRPSATSSTKQPVSLGAHSQASSHSSVGSELDDFEDELKEAQMSTKLTETWMKTRTSLHRHWLVVLIILLICSPIFFFLLYHWMR